MNKTLTLLAIFLSGLFEGNTVLANSPTPSTPTVKMQQFIQQQLPAQIDLLKTLVDINSGTTNINGVQNVGKVLMPQFEQLGFKTSWREEPSSMQRAGTLIAQHPGKGGKSILLIGHLDTVFPSDSPFHAFKQQGNIATGQGVGDDKGGDVVILYALKALQSVDALSDKNITVVLTGDEEDSGKPSSISRKPLIDAAKNSKIALEFECASDLHSAVVARRGISDWVLMTTGKGGHSSQIFRSGSGDGAIFEITRIITTMRTQLSTQPHITVNPGIILGGTQIDFEQNTSEGSAKGKPNVISVQAIAKGDLRFLTEEQKTFAETTMKNIVSHHLADTAASIRFINGIAGMTPSAGNLALLKQYSQISEQLGYGGVTAIDPDLRGASDISFVANQVPANLAGLGPVCAHPHSTLEQIDVNSLTIETERAAVLLLQF